MEETRFDCNCDTVIEMEELGVGVDEILQYCRAILPRREVTRLAGGLRAVLAASRMETSEEEELREPSAVG